MKPVTPKTSQKSKMMCKIFQSMTFLILLFSMVSYSQDWEEHGRLKVSENGHYLEHEDGKGFFWLGCTAWMLPRLNPSDVDRYLKNRAEKGFTVIQVNVTNMKRPNFEGEWPFVGEERPWQKVQFNETYWKHIDHIIERAAHHGLYVAVFVWWGTAANDSDQYRKKDEPTRQFFSNPDTHNYQFGKLLGKRYNDHPNIIWVGAGEYHKMVSVMFPNNQRPLTEEHKRRLVRVIEGIRESDQPGKHLYTMHPISFLSSSEEFHTTEWLDFNMIQSHAVPEFIQPLTNADWHRLPIKPTFNAEGWYENEENLYERWTGMRKSGEDTLDPDWVQRYQAYWSVFSGGFGFTYGHKNIWRMETDSGQVGVLKDETLNAPGSASLSLLKKLVTSKPIQSRIPDPLLVSSGTTGRDAGLSPDLRISTRAEDGSWAFVYTTRGSLIRVNMDRLAPGKAMAYWFNPSNGKWRKDAKDMPTQEPFRTDIPSGPNTTAEYFDPPGKAADGNDWVLVLEVEP